ncbi:MAG: hypothetical protein OXU61_10015 [Gammaproteobacteria bacterium]|nr:hypothetical protein [Gammaproteobacteria bacterium]
MRQGKFSDSNYRNTVCNYGGAGDGIRRDSASPARTNGGGARG